MKLHLLSDLHLEFAPFTTPQVAADVVILAGDYLAGTFWGAMGKGNVSWEAGALPHGQP